MKILALIILSTFFISCSNLSQRVTKQGGIDFTGGVSKDKRWEDALELKRQTWFYELSIVYDALYFTIDKTSPFYQWLSTDEKSDLSQCRKFLVAITYKNPTHAFSAQVLSRDLLKAGFLSISTPNFTENIKNHPDYRKWDLNYHRVQTYCQSNSKDNTAKVNVPGFQEVSLSF